MCGIAGIIYKNPGARVEQVLLDRLANRLKHRGPDDVGFHLSGNMGFLNTRLAIVDRAGGNQPIYSANGKIGIVFNGEIYNYKELKEELKQKGAIFKTDSDTEVILRLYEEIGAKAFEQLNGMFAICLWDNRNNQIFLVRDRIGIKPLYIYEDQDKIIFASEVKAFIKLDCCSLTLDPLGIQDYLVYRYIQAPLTIFKEVHKLEPAHIIKINVAKNAPLKTQTIYYADGYQSPQNVSTNLGDIKEQLRQILTNSVQSQLMGEAPIALLLSGGVDSSIIAYTLKKLNTKMLAFCIGFKEINEFEYARQVADKFALKLVEVVTSADELFGELDQIIEAIDEPLADAACFPLFKMCQSIVGNAKVVLSGEGSDELFAGYSYYADLVKRPPPAHVIFDQYLSKLSYFKDAPEKLFCAPQTIPPQHLRTLKHFQPAPSLLEAMLNFDQKTWLPENLMMKADKILMRFGLEGRFPFLDLNLWQFAKSLPDNLKIKDNQQTKYLLKESFREPLPPDVMQRSKMGFSVPIGDFLKKASSIFNALLNLPIGSTKLDQYLSRSQASHIFNLSTMPNNTREQRWQAWSLFVLYYWCYKHKL
ncbi:MAG TPA: asparagine synthase (glutamine-hydrolyzing) [Oligoflexia bacterium]|nr:asparagine synthase (glutamine-hydrolyzing) [Oligoflexia bacterium]HMP27044.1 asparagine synthase (glutamine-hydrolyzing) [Oligoflexia bacterium]